jgi:polysaccharide biosynthesis protein PslH
MSYSTTIRLLHVAPRFYGRPITGAELRNYHLGTGLARHMSVTHIGFSSPQEDPQLGVDGPRHRFLSVPRAARYRPLDLLRGVITSTPFSVWNYTRREMKHALTVCLREQQFDIVQLEGVQLGGYLPLLRRATNRPCIIVCDWHNIESEVLHRYAEYVGSGARGLYARNTARKLEAFERLFVNQCDLHVVVSERDRDTLIRYGTKVPIVVVENGISFKNFSVKTVDGGAAGLSFSRERFRVLFVGFMGYHANVDAVKFFSQEIWPLVHQCLPKAVFTVVGRDPSDEIRKLGTTPGIEVTGTVPDVHPYYDEAFVAVTPLRVGGGSRIKILEAMAAGVPVVSTACGAEGLEIVPDTHYVLAETREAMLEAVVGLSRDGFKAARLVRAADEFVRRRHDWTSLADALAKQLLTMVERTRTAGAASAD